MLSHGGAGPPVYRHEAAGYPRAVRGAARASVFAAFIAGAAASCFHEDFLLGARCGRDSECGRDQCCASRRCRPATGNHCLQSVESDEPYVWAYSACTSDDECLAHGMPRCVRLDGAPAGFCADLCVGIEENCQTHEESASRICLEFDDQRLCALACCPDGGGCECGAPPLGPCPEPCPDAMQCRDGVCVPQAPP